MLPGWASRIRLRSRPSVPAVQHSLVKIAPFVLLLLSLVPLLLLGTFSTLRTRSLLRSQLTTQLKNIGASEIEQISQYVSLREKVIESLVSEENFQNQLAELFASQPGTTDYMSVKS
ncbi:MAG: hypothetical protein IH586_17170, partial [Anaerolineaceae bacterium]|nr:hypothetical protein [Anaerolineaceae bacterium]